ncbi:MAG: glycine zipper 2TM domain-containing protein [Synechococcus sp.]
MKRSFGTGVAVVIALAATAPAFHPAATAAPLTVYDYGRDDMDRRDGTAGRRVRSSAAADTDTNSCVEGSVIGGLLGAGLGAALSRGNGRWIGVPVGGAAGALLGCQVDGG